MVLQSLTKNTVFLALLLSIQNNIKYLISFAHAFIGIGGIDKK